MLRRYLIENEFKIFAKKKIVLCSDWNQTDWRYFFVCLSAKNLQFSSSHFYKRTLQYYKFVLRVNFTSSFYRFTLRVKFTSLFYKFILQVYLTSSFHHFTLKVHFTCLFYLIEDFFITLKFILLFYKFIYLFILPDWVASS